MVGWPKCLSGLVVLLSVSLALRLAGDAARPGAFSVLQDGKAAVVLGADVFGLLKNRTVLRQFALGLCKLKIIIGGP